VRAFAAIPNTDIEIKTTEAAITVFESKRGRNLQNEGVLWIKIESLLYDP